MGRRGTHLLLEEAGELAQAAALHLVSCVLGLRLELGLHVVELGDRRRGIQLFEQSAPGLEKCIWHGEHAWVCELAPVTIGGFIKGPITLAIKGLSDRPLKAPLSTYGIM